VGMTNMFMGGEEVATCGRCQRVELVGGGARGVERGWQPGRSCGLDITPLLASSRLQLAGLEASTVPSSPLSLCR
jgi:hypothetical protein